MRITHKLIFSLFLIALSPRSLMSMQLQTPINVKNIHIPLKELNAGLALALQQEDVINVQKLLIAGAHFAIYIQDMINKFTQLTKTKNT